MFTVGKYLNLSAVLQLLSVTKDRDIIKIVFAIMKIDQSIQYQEMQRPSVTLIFEDLVNLRYIRGNLPPPPGKLLNTKTIKVW